MDPWKRIVVLSIGGALGVNARYWLAESIIRLTGPRFPWSTVTINVSGSFAIGFLSVALASLWPNPLARLFLITGFLGGYTTFSAFSFESLDLWEQGQRRLSAANAIGSVAAGLVAVVLGVALARALIVTDVRNEPLVDPTPGVAERADAVEDPSASPRGGGLAGG